MDGLAHGFPLQTIATTQRTLKMAIDCVGVGVHSGRKVSLRLLPAPVDSGIVFRRTDLPGGPVDIPARFDLVSDTRLCTVLELPGRPETRVGTVEHLMAALMGCGITNVVAELDGPEVPILDGSAEPFVFLIGCAGLLDQAAAAPVIEVLRPVRVAAPEVAFAELRPAPPAAAGLDAAMSIAFDAVAIGRQALSLRVTAESFASELARARTFTQLREIEALRAAGLARGGSLDNAVVVDNDRVLNPAGLRMADEFVRHKLLDAVGDLGLAGAALHARFVAHRTGHALNNRLLRALFADRANWRVVGAGSPQADHLPAPGGTTGLPGWRDAHLPVAASPA
ncbi:MAG: UDP-3-O-[3-hydroxymyristoyl] N-acetylglucosamine deacetylase [Acetobacteraceae bacterium SCN 69-10]|nr:MAG: UDP-3-O-[3-hydroxymyristoyl] N-acetylglucosamine deacetylase [Acetobacteraceae bacterium SCN 69-10]